MRPKSWGAPSIVSGTLFADVFQPPYSLPFKGRVRGGAGVSDRMRSACGTAQACKPVCALQGGMGFKCSAGRY